MKIRYPLGFDVLAESVTDLLRSDPLAISCLKDPKSPAIAKDDWLATIAILVWRLPIKRPTPQSRGDIYFLARILGR